MAQWWQAVKSARQVLDASLTEKQFRTMVMRAAKLAGWECYYTRDSRLCTSAGFPDTVFFHPSKMHLGLIIWELKVGKNKPTQAQVMWLKAFAVNNPHARVVRPEDWTYIVQTLTAA